MAHFINGYFINVGNFKLSSPQTEEMVGGDMREEEPCDSQFESRSEARKRCI